MIKTYLVPITEEMVKAMESGEAPSFLHCATCLDGLTNGEVIQKMFPDCTIFPTGNFVLIIDKNDKTIGSFDLDFWNSKWGERT